LGASYTKRKQQLLAQAAYEDALVVAPNSVDGQRAKAWLRKYSTSRPVRRQGDTVATQRIERSLLEYRPIEGDWGINDNGAINGRVFDRVGRMTGYSRPGDPLVANIVFRNRGFDRVEAWIGSQKRKTGHELPAQFQVLGDGKLLYTSPYLGVNDPTIQISIPIRGYSAVTLLVRGSEDETGYVAALWANPIFLKRY
jgi:hypothetical protein